LVEGQADSTFGRAVPERLGRYPLLNVIGTGSMAVVYKSFDPQISRAIAIKTLRRELLDDEMENYPARLRIEAQAAGGLTHPGIVRVYEYGEAEGYAYIAMEYVEGHSLRDCFERKVRFNTDQAVNILAQLLQALQHAHENGVWHRDVKPANILLLSDGQVKVTDFGIARVAALNLAQADSIMGTPGFIAPEMYLSEAFDHRIDLFAAGVVFYQLLAGVPPFSGTPEKIMFKVCYETPLPVSVVARQPALRVFDAVVLKALARRPEDRFGSASEFREALLLAQAGASINGDQTVIVSRRSESSSANSDETVIVPRRPVSTDETVLVSRQRTGGPSRQDETLLVSGRSPPDEADLTILRPLSRASSHDTQQLTQLEQQLARFVGPIARVLVRGASQETSDLPSLIQTLAAKIERLPEREAFLRSAAAATASTTSFTSLRSAGDTGTGGDLTGGGAPLTPEYVARAAQLLAVHVGPIATVLAKRAAQPGSSQEEFVAILAAHLNDDRERARFLRALTP
jgi:eukaryotic-like serine/threonine-protein kinase